jgi:NtrC-family two-component system response regulator AlgB
MRVLIIDDEAGIRRITAMALADMGHETADVENGAQALAQLAAAHFDVALLDLKLDNENGMDLISKLREMTPDLGVVMLTGSASRENARAARQAGAAAMISKPFTPDEIRQTLRRFSPDEVSQPD